MSARHHSHMILSAFDSPLFQRDEGDTQNRLLVIQCDSGHLNGDLIACARYRVYDERVNALNKNKIQNREGVTHVLFIINLPHQVSSSSFVGFQGDPWISAHIDDLRPTSSDSIDPLHAIAKNISDLFIGEYIADIAPLLDPTREQLQQQVSESDSVESLLEEEFSTQEVLGLLYAGEDADDEGNQSEGEDAEAHQSQPEDELQAERSSSSEAPTMDDVEQLESLEQSTDFPGQLESPSESMAFVMQRQSFQENEDAQPPTDSDLATAQTIATNEMEVLDIEEIEMNFSTTFIPEGRLGPIVQSTEIVATAFQEYQDVSSLPALESAEDETGAPTFLDESLTQSQTTQLAEPDISQVSVLADVSREEAYNQEETHPPPVVSQRSSKRQPRNGQCRRLYNCIQAAASRLEDSTKDRSTQRVARLTKLIQRYPDHLGN